jgi:hypothetical protein
MNFPNVLLLVEPQGWVRWVQVSLWDAYEWVGVAGWIFPLVQSESTLLSSLISKERQ